MASDNPPAVQISIDPVALGSLIETVVEQTVHRLEEARKRLPDEQLCFTEAQAAEILGLQKHQLRDARMRGEIQPSYVVCGKISYSRQDLLDFLAGQRWNRREHGKPPRNLHRNGAAH